MTDFAANDFAAIAKAMRAEPVEDQVPYCTTCEGCGWECNIGIGGAHLRECSDCHNPKDLPKP